MQNRFKSKVLWMSIVSQVLMILTLCNAWQGLGVTEDWAKGIIAAIFEILTLIGVFNNPTDSVNW